MAPPESEWMLWAYRVKTFMQAELDKVRQELPDRTASLLQDSDGLDSLKQQVHELAASSEHTHQTNQSLQHRIQKIESEATSQDQKLADQSGKLQATARDLERQIEHAVETFEQFKREARAAAEEREQEVADSKRQIEALALLKKTEKQGRSASKPVPEVTTPEVDSDGNMDLIAGHPRHHNISNISQGGTTYEQYLHTSEGFIGAAQAQAVKAVVSGMKYASRREKLQKVLEAKGWTWANAKRELQKIVDETKVKRGGKRKARLPPVSELDTSSMINIDMSSETINEH